MSRRKLLIHGGSNGMRIVFALCLIGIVQLSLADMLSRSTSVEMPTPTKRAVLDAFGSLPLSFEPNQGQADVRVQFLARGSGHTLFLTSSETVLVFGPISGKTTQAVVRMRLISANPKPRIVGREELAGKVHYFLGNDPALWRTAIPTYSKVIYQEAYPGIDLIYYGNQRLLEYDFVVRPGANPASIVLGFQGVERIDLNAQGDLLLHTAAGELRQLKPSIYQEVNGTRRSISGGYVLRGKGRVGFQVASYDASKPLIIDPLIYSTFLGGSADEGGHGIAVDSTGNVYVTGFTRSLNFPITAGASDTSFNSGVDTFVTKLNSTGTTLVYSTFLGGIATDTSRSIAADGSGSAYVSGETESNNFPTTAGAFDTSHNGGVDVFVTKVNPTGSVLIYSTFLGGTDTDGGQSVAADSTGNAYVTGQTRSPNFPTTAGAFDTSFNGATDAFVTKLNPAGSALVYSTFLGGSASDFYGAQGIAVDSSGNAYVTGATASSNFPTTTGAIDTSLNGSFDAFVTKLNAGGSALAYSTFLGGSADEGGIGVAVDGSGNAFVIGQTDSGNFPTTSGAFDRVFNRGEAFVTKLNSVGSTLVYSTFLGGSVHDVGRSIAVDASGSAYVTGETGSRDFPTTTGALDASFDGEFDAFVTKLNPVGSALVYSTFLGGGGIDAGQAIAVDGTGTVYVTGQTASSNFPTTAGAFDTSFNGTVDAFVAKIDTSQR